MGNCDTHVFLGSNSYKTVEYFSKALGEKTISRESKGTNKDKHYHKQGYNYSEQIMGRPLMTPDELRRMDNNECIILEKGIKPVKAGKFYYYEQPKMLRDIQKVKLNHLNFDVGSRGDWRKYNPYNPYVADKPNSKQENLKVESLDDLFEDDFIENKNEQKIEEKSEPVNTTASNDFEFIDGLEDVTPVKEEPKAQTLEDDLFEFEEFDSPTLPQEPISEDVFTEDLQKELEAKFDELFGPME